MAETNEEKSATKSEKMEAEIWWFTSREWALVGLVCAVFALAYVGVAWHPNLVKSFFNVTDAGADGVGRFSVFGPIGDFFGGIINPILTFFTVCLLLYSNRMQRKELQNSEKALKDNKDAIILQRQDNAKSLYLNYLEEQLKYYSNQSVELGKLSDEIKNLDSNISNNFKEMSIEARKKCLELGPQRNALISELRALAGFPKLPVKSEATSAQTIPLA